MRALLLAFLIAILPIRGVLGDAFAIEMVQMQNAAQATMADQMDGTANVARAALPCERGTGLHHPGGSGHACEMCQTVTLAASPCVLLSREPCHPHPQVHVPLYISVLTLPGLRPPIA